MESPKAEKQEYFHKEHGEKRLDSWYWLRDIEDPKVMSYLKEENKYTDYSMNDTVDFQKTIFEELKSRIKEDDTSATEKDGDYDYFDKTIKDEQYGVYCRTHRASGAETEVLLDCNKLAKGKDFLELGVCEVSPDHKLLAYSLDEEGDEKYSIYIKNLETGEILKDKIENTYYGFEWTNDCKSFYYTELDDQLRPKWAKHHILGQPTSSDRVIYEESDPRFFVSIDKSDSYRFLYVVTEGNNMSEWFYGDGETGLDEIKMIQPRGEDHEYQVSDYGDSFYIRTDYKAPDYKIVKTLIEKPGLENWTDFVAHRDGCLLEGFSTYQHFFVIMDRVKGQNNLRVIDMRTNTEHTVEFDGESYELGFGGGREYDTPLLRYSYSSMASPGLLFDYDMETRERTLIKTQQIPDPKFDAANYETKRIYATADDGVQIPVSILYRKGTKLDGSAPLVLYAYGSYGLSMDASFSRTRVSYADRGVVYGIAHVRGGMELGKSWYLDGKLLKKKNTFSDFIACAETLVSEKYTSKGKIAAIGGSAGGMLMGVISNMRPDLFGGIVSQVPFVDVLNTMLDDTLPLTTSEYNEWGNPTDREYYDYIKSYSPYDNVSSQAYPPMLIECGLNDTRVTYWEPAKWVAKLRDMKVDENMILLKTNMDSGHGGASGRYDYLKDAAFEIAFVCKVLGVE